MSLPVSQFHRVCTLQAKRVVDFIRAHPEGVTAKDLHAAGIGTTGLDRLLHLRLIRGTEVKEPEKGPRAFHWLWRAT